MDALISKLKSLPPDTPITSGQLAALLEAFLAQHNAQPRTLGQESWDNLPNDKELTTDELGQWLRKAPNTLAKLRVKGTGPAYKPGKPVIYRVGDVKDWLAKRKVNSTSEATVRGIHRFNSLPDSEPFLWFSGSFVPFNLESALDFVGLNGEKCVIERVFICSKSSDDLTATLQNTDTMKQMISLKQHVDLFSDVLRHAEGGSDNIYAPVLSYAESFFAQYPDGELECEAGKGSLFHLLVEFANEIELIPHLNVLNYQEQAITALENLDSLGIDRNHKNEYRKTPCDLASTNSAVKQWFISKEEIAKLRQTLKATDSNAKKKGKIL